MAITVQINGAKDFIGKVAYVTLNAETREVLGLEIGERGKAPEQKEGTRVVNLGTGLLDAVRKYPDDGRPLILRYDAGSRQLVKVRDEPI